MDKALDMCLVQLERMIREDPVESAVLCQTAVAHRRGQLFQVHIRVTGTHARQKLFKGGEEMFVMFLSKINLFFKSHKSKD